MKHVFHYLAIAASLLLLGACGTNTHITGSYKSPELGTTGTKYKKIFITALTSNISTREKVETSLAEPITARGFEVVKSIDVMTPAFRDTSGAKSHLVLEKVKETQSDAILTVALVNKETETRYVPGSVYPVTAYPYYGSFGAYWGNWYGTMYDPGYYTTDKIYYVETNLYDAATEKILWSAQSETMDPLDIDDFLQGYKKAIEEQLVKDGLLAPLETTK